MNTSKYMIIVKGVIKTKDIRSCKYDCETKKWNVVYYNNETVFSYAYTNVEYLKEPKVLNPNLYRISREGKSFFNIQAIYVFCGRDRSYWHICFENGSEKDYEQHELKVCETCLTDEKSRNVFTYLTQISELSDLKNDKTGEKILAKKYGKIDYVDTQTALAVYLNPSGDWRKKGQETVPIFPFGCNNSQYKAVRNALENQISIIQGPPGTGKTQTILNIIANILIQGKTVQVVSNNNSAIDNVYEKLASAKYNLDFIVASLGNADNKKTFIRNQNAVYPDFSSWMMQEEKQISLQEIKSKSSQLEDVFKKQERLAGLRQETAQLSLEKKYFDEYLNETEAGVDFTIKKKITSARLMLLWQECQSLAESNKKIGMLFRLKCRFKYGINGKRFYQQDISKMITCFQKLFYQYKQEELESEIKEITEYLHNTNGDLLEDLCSQSMILLKDTLARRYKNAKERVVFSEEDLWKNSQKVLEEYPVVLSTTFSSRSSLNDNIIYDYLIMDEASQVDTATGALALSCARNAVIVGDTKQLPNVVPQNIKSRSDSIFSTFRIAEGYRFTNSFLQSVIQIIPNVAQVLLKEHYRCHPKIINFCNQKFYRDELVIMTEDKGEQNVLTAVKTKMGNHVRDHYSQRQIDVIKREVIPQLKVDTDEMGIITPYKNQVSALQKEITDIDSATVHKFQGREKDTIIISTVDDIISDFADDPYLLNVAVSRAKNKLVLVVSGNEQSAELNISDLLAYIQYNNFEIKESLIYSVFDYLYKQYTAARQEYLGKHKKISGYDSENLMYALITEVLAENAYAGLDVVCHMPLRMLIKNPVLLNDRECRYAMHHATHLDFLIYNRISKQPVLCIEVDGYKYHKEGTAQASRDVLKDHILNLYHIPILRFRTNGSGEKEKLTEKLSEIYS